MLPKENRLLKERDFHRLYQTARPRFSRFFSLRCAKNEGASTRIGIVISQKVDKDASGRNLLKRRVRTLFEAIFPLLPVKRDIILSLTPAAKNASFHELQDDLYRLLNVCNLLPPDHRLR